MLSEPTTTILSAGEYHDLWLQPDSGLAWDCVFVLPFWLETVCRHLGPLGEPRRIAVWEEGRLVGLAPLAIEGDTCLFLGPPSVCDYQDIVVRRGYAGKVVQTLLRYLAGHGVRHLDLQTLHPGAAMLKGLQDPATRSLYTSMDLVEEDVAYETALPATWDDYLMQLNGKQRHEVRRKVRRLEATGPVSFGLTRNNGRLNQAEEIFLKLFCHNRQDKGDFMTDAMQAYFRDLIRAMAKHDLLRLCFLDLDHQAAAAALCFDYKGVRYLYNSGYDKRFEKLGVGILCKVLSIRQGIEMGCRHYDFLKGAEAYKKHIGGRKVPLYRCTLALSDLNHRRQTAR